MICNGLFCVEEVHSLIYLVYFYRIKLSSGQQTFFVFGRFQVTFSGFRSTQGIKAFSLVKTYCCDEDRQTEEVKVYNSGEFYIEFIGFFRKSPGKVFNREEFYRELIDFFRKSPGKGLQSRRVLQGIHRFFQEVHTKCGVHPSNIQPSISSQLLNTFKLYAV